MDSPRKLIVGYDLCEDFTRISCYSYKSFEPISIGIEDGKEDVPIPTVLCIRNDTRQWIFGEEALRCTANGEGILVDHLLTKARNEELLQINQTSFSAIALMEIFLRKTLLLVKNYFPTEPITKLVVTVTDTHPAFVDKIYQSLALLGIEKDRAVVMSHAGAYLYYAMSQDRSLWMNDVGLFDFNEEGLQYYQIHINRRVKPIIAGLSRKDLSEELNASMLQQKNINCAYIFENLANTILYKQVVSTIYFTGKGFEEDWSTLAIKNLCAGRRVFLGQNLYTKGACYAAKELSGDQMLQDMLLLNDDMITTSVLLRVFCDTRWKEVPLAKAGETWYEVHSTVEVIPEGAAELMVLRKDILSKDILYDTFIIDGLPERPDRMTRLCIEFTCENRNKGSLKVIDLGFGEFYPESGFEMIFPIEI
jgi:hypothetical protein